MQILHFALVIVNLTFIEYLIVNQQQQKKIQTYRKNQILKKFKLHLAYATGARNANLFGLI